MSLSPAAVLGGVGRLLRRPRADPSTPVPEADAIGDIESAFAGYRFETVFDVGAHRGDVAARFLDRFPSVRLHAFEPAPASFKPLSERFKGEARATLNQRALAGRPGRLGFLAQGDLPTNRLFTPAAGAAAPKALVAVEATTGDAYCEAGGIEKISYLKIAAEGADLRVLWGFRRMLSAGAVDFVQVEASMTPDSRSHVAFEELKDHLESFGLRLFRIYGQQPDKRLPTLKRAVLVFATLVVAERYART